MQAGGGIETLRNGVDVRGNRSGINQLLGIGELADPLEDFSG